MALSSRCKAGALAATAVLVAIGCDRLEFRLPDEPRLEVIAWPDTLTAGDTSVAALRVIDADGRTWEAKSADWEVVDAGVAGLLGTGDPLRKRVVAIAAGTTRIQIDARVAEKGAEAEFRVTVLP